MARRLMQVQSVVLAAVSLGLLLVPFQVLSALGVAPTSFGVVSLVRVIAALLMIVAASTLGLTLLQGSARALAFGLLSAAYGAATLLLLAQEIAIWTTVGGAVVVAAAAEGCVTCLFAARGAQQVEPGI
jgi:hypothetical protein